MHVETIVEKLLVLGFAGDYDHSPATLQAYSHDASICEVTPTLVVYPRDSMDIARVVRLVVALREAGDTAISFAMRGAGTCMSGGSLTAGIVVDTTRYLNTCSGVTKGEYLDRETGALVSGYTITTQPGVYCRDMERVTTAMRDERPI